MQILPVPFALRASVADSAANSNGALSWGDSLVLKDASGDKRFVINPNTGEFKVMRNDTVWYEIASNSPPTTKENYGANNATTEYVTVNGKDFTKHTRTTDGYKIETWIQHSTDAGNNDTMSKVLTYNKSNCLVTETTKVYDKKIKKVKECTVTFDCPSGNRLAVKCVTLAGPTSSEPDFTDNEETDTKTEESTDDGKLQMVTVDKRSNNQVKATFDAKDSCFVIEANKIILKTKDGQFMIKVNKDGTIEQKSSNDKNDFIKMLIDPEKGTLSYEDSMVLKYQFVDENTIRMLIQQVGQGANVESILEEYNLENAAYVSNGINNFKRLVDSVLVYKVVSKKTKDSIQALYDAIGHVLRYEDVQKFMEVNKYFESSRTYEEGKITKTDTDLKTGDFVTEIRNLSDGVDVIEGLKGNDVIMSDTPYTTRYIYDDGKSTPIRVQVDPPNSTMVFDEADLIVRQNIKGTHTSEYTNGKHTITKTVNTKDSTVKYEGGHTYIYDGLERRVIQSDVSMTHEYDAANNKIEETIIPGDMAMEYTGLLNRHHYLDTNVFVESYVDNNGDEISILYEPTDKIINYDGVDFVEWEFDKNLTVLTSLGTGQSTLANASQTKNEAVAITLDQENRFIQLGDPLGGKVATVVDTLIAQDFAAIDGNVFIKGNLQVQGNVAKQGGSFKIDHPQDPYNKYLVHSFVESPDMMNVYNGNVVTDSAGMATVTLTDYFESLNMEYRYQLTCIGTFAQAIVLEKVEDNVFKIQTNKPDVEVSWQVTGIRKDPYATDNRIKVVQEKEENKKGTLLHQPILTNQ